MPPVTMTIPRTELQRKRHIEYIKSPEALGTGLLGIVLNAFGAEALEWEPDTIVMELVDRFGVEVPDENRDKLFALMTALNTDQFYVNPLTFTYICQALNGDAVDFETFNPPDPEDLAWGVTEVLLNDIALEDEPNTDQQFKPEVARFVGTILQIAGMLIAPANLEFADYPNGGGFNEDDPLFTEDVSMYQAALGTQQGLKAETDAYVNGRVEALTKHIEWLMLKQEEPAK